MQHGWDDTTTVQIVISIMAGLVPSTVIPFVLYYYNKKSEKQSRPLLFNSANRVFSLLSGKNNKYVWKLLPKLYKEYIEGGCIDLNIFHGEHHHEIYQFKENLNKLGALYLADVIDEKFLFNTYGGKLIEFYLMLRNDIKNIRGEINVRDEKMDSEDHCLLFECTFYAAVNYMRRHNDPRLKKLEEKFGKFPDILNDMDKRIPKEYYDRIKEYDK